MSRSVFASLALCVSFAVTLSGQPYAISTIAGNGAPGFLDGAGTGSQLNLPANLFVTSSGTLYIADGSNNRVRLLSSGNVTTVAGTGTASFSGDGAAATSATLNDPLGVAADSSGNIFIADTVNSVVRKVTSGGVISTFAGNNGFGAGFTGDAGAATAAQLDHPVGIVLDSAGNLYIADSSNNLIRKVNSSGTITTVLGSGSTAGRLNHPIGLAVDAAGNVYIADVNNNRIAKFTVATNALTNFAGNGSIGFSGDGGQATLAQLADPAAVAVDAAGNVYIADTLNNRIRKVTPAGIISTIAGTGRVGYTGDGGPAISAQLNSPSGLAVDKSGNVYVADTRNSVIRLLVPSLPIISAGGVANAASFQPRISPGALASVFGTGFGTDTSSPAGNPNLPVIAGGVSVTVNGQASPLYYVSPSQINFQVPWATPVGTASVVVSVSGGGSNTVSVPVLAAGPGLFTAGGAAIAQNFPDFSLNSPSNPAAAGSTIIAYLTGSGPVNATVADGAPSPSTLAQSTSSWSATIGPAAAQVSFLGLTPGFVGLVQANIIVPAGLAPGTYPLTISIGGTASNSASISTK